MMLHIDRMYFFAVSHELIVIKKDYKIYNRREDERHNH
jgi:hypothetical protein